MNLVIDVGNTRTKYAFFDEERFVEAKYQVVDLFADIEKWKEAGEDIHLFLAGSGKMDKNIQILLKKSVDSFLDSSQLQEYPIKIGYAKPEQLGVDRIANCVGAASLYPERNLLVIDSGTCITYNYMNVEGVFLGGNISPGVELRFRSLNEYTEKLPYVTPSENYGGIGKTTEEAIRNGVMNGILFEIEQTIQNFIAEYADGKIVITGGNSCYLKENLKFEADYCEILGFIGLNKMFVCEKK